MQFNLIFVCINVDMNFEVIDGNSILKKLELVYFKMFKIVYFKIYKVKQ